MLIDLTPEQIEEIKFLASEQGVDGDIVKAMEHPLLSEEEIQAHIRFSTDYIQ